VLFYTNLSLHIIFGLLSLATVHVLWKRYLLLEALCQNRESKILPPVQTMPSRWVVLIKAENEYVVRDHVYKIIQLRFNQVEHPQQTDQ